MLDTGINLENIFCDGDVFMVAAGDSLWYSFQFDNYDAALKKFEELKGKGFCSVELSLLRVLKVEVKENGNDND